MVLILNVQKHKNGLRLLCIYFIKYLGKTNYENVEKIKLK